MLTAMSIFRLIALMVVALTAAHIAVRDEWIVDGGYTQRNCIKSSTAIIKPVTVTLSSVCH